MSDARKTTETTRVETETEQDTDGSLGGEYRKATTVKTERTVEQEKEKEPVVIIHEE